MEKVKWNKFEILWLTIFLLINIYILMVSDENVLGFIASVTGIICVVLVAKGMLLNYLFGIINVVAYGYISYQSKYYGEAMLNFLYYLPMQFVGFFMWQKWKIVNRNNEEQLKVKCLDFMEWFTLVVFSTILIIGYGYLLDSWNNTLPYVDSFTTVMSVIAMILMVKRYIDQWIIWIVINIVTIYMWVFVKTNPAITVMWIAYLINAVYGYINWKKMYRTQQLH